MPVDYRTLKAGFYWVRWKGEVTVAEWKTRDDHWIEGLLGGWVAGRFGEVTRLCHVWDVDGDVLDVECLQGPLAPPGEEVTPIVRFVNHTRHRLGAQVVAAGAAGGAPDRITLIVEEEI